MFHAPVIESVFLQGNVAPFNGQVNLKNMDNECQLTDLIRLV